MTPGVKNVADAWQPDWLAWVEALEKRVAALEEERDYLKGRVTILEMARDLQEVVKDLPPLRQRYFHEPRPGEETDGA